MLRRQHTVDWHSVRVAMLCLSGLNLLPFLLLLREKICDFILLYAMKMIVNRRRLSLFGHWRMPKNLGIKPLFGRI